jgi:hypothetical protein
MIRIRSSARCGIGGSVLAAVIGSGGLTLSAHADHPVGTRGEIIERATRYTTYDLHTAADGPLRVQNLLRSEYAVSQCTGDTCTQGATDQHKSSDAFWRVPPECSRVYRSWMGTPYCFGRGQPDGHVPTRDDYQAGLDAGHGIGEHQCHYIGAGSPYGGDPDMEGIDCSGLACSALGMPYIGTSQMNGPVGLQYLALVDLCCAGSLLVHFGHHVVVVTSFDAATVSCIEATGENPFAWAQTYPLSYFLNYSAMDSKAVAQCQASDGNLYARLRADGAVSLTWVVVGARDAGRYEFQRRRPGAPAWMTFAELDAGAGTGRHTYEALYLPGPDGEGTGTEFRIRETETCGRRLVYGETRPLAAAGGEPGLECGGMRR